MVQLKSRALAPNMVPKNKHTDLGNLKTESLRERTKKTHGLNTD